MHKVYFVTGKGGVGKSSVAAFLAKREVLLGKKTLLVEMGPWSYFEKWWDFKATAQYQPLKTPYGFSWAMWTGEDCLKEYVGHLIKLPFLSKAFLGNSWMQALIKIAPGLREISFLGKATSQIRKHGPALDYETIVVDAVSTGHFLSLLQAPKGLRGMASFGPIHDQCVSILEALNSASVETWVVTTLETFAIQESFELLQKLKQSLSSKVELIANGDLQIPEISVETIQSYEGEKKQILNTLLFMSEHQKNFKNILYAKYAFERTIPFYYKPLTEVLNDDAEISRIYQEY